MGQKAESPRRARATRMPRQVLTLGAKTRIRVFADIQNFALRAHCVHGIPDITLHCLGDCMRGFATVLTKIT